MGIPKKGSRIVDVDGHEFRYIVRQAHVLNNPKHLLHRVTVQQACEKPGRVLQVDLAYGTEVGPTLVKGLIQAAIREGWNPEERGSAYGVLIDPPDVPMSTKVGA